MVEECNSGDWNMAELCRFYGVTRVTGNKWGETHELEKAHAPQASDEDLLFDLYPPIQE